MLKILFLGVLILISGCHKDPQQTCGCESPAVSTLSNTRGIFYYNSANNSYYIATLPIDVPYYSVSICEPHITQLDIFFRPDTKDTVVFSGQVKKMCDDEAKLRAGPVWPQDKITISAIAISH